MANPATVVSGDLIYIFSVTFDINLKDWGLVDKGKIFGHKKHKNCLDEYQVRLVAYLGNQW